MCSDHPRRAFGGLYHRGRFGWHRYSSFDNMQVFIFCDLGLKTPIHAPKIGVLGDLTLQMGSYLMPTTKKALSCAETRHTTYRSSKSVHQCGLAGLGAIPRIKLKERKRYRGLLRNRNVTSHVFAETTHVVAAPCGFACVVIPPT